MSEDSPPEDSPHEDSPPEDQSIKQISPEKALGGCALGGCLVLLGGYLVLLVVYGMLTDSGKDTVQVESPEATGEKMKSTGSPVGKGFLPETFAKTFEIPAGDKDVYGNLIHKGTDEKTGMPKEIRHKTTGIHLVLIASGSFQMGSNNGHNDEKPAHKVTITKPFYLGKYEVTQAEWLKAMNSKPWENKKYAGRVTTASVNSVSWIWCQSFLDKLNQSSGLKSGMRFALPTEAQWEYACRAEAETSRYYGQSESLLEHYAWYQSNSKDRSWPVARLKPNDFGLFDMQGNVWEWCADWYQADAIGHH